MSDNDCWFFAPVDGHGILLVLVTFFMNANKAITNSWLLQDLINVVSSYSCLDYESKRHYRLLHSIWTRACSHTSNYSALLELLPRLPLSIEQANLKVFILCQIFTKKNPYNAYMDVWSPSVGDEFALEINKPHIHDWYAVVTKVDGCVVIRKPRFMWSFHRPLLGDYWLQSS